MLGMSYAQEITLAEYQFASNGDLDPEVGAVGSPSLSISNNVSFSGTYGNPFSSLYTNRDNRRVTISMSTVGYENIKVEWDGGFWFGNSNGTHQWQLSANNGSGYGGVLYTQNCQEDQWDQVSYSLDNSFDNNSTINIRLTSNVSNDRYVYLDNFRIKGTPIVGYCPSSGNTNFNTAITLVEFNTINNNVTVKTSGYQDYTSQSTDVMAGSSHNITVNLNTDGDYWVYSMVWIDWNQDMDFDDSGEAFDLGSVRNVSNGATSNSPYSISVPASAALGATRMRVAARYDAYPNACGQGFDGEVEDYTINVISGSVPTIASFTPGNACSNSNQVVTITGTNFTNATAVNFNGVAASYTISNDNQIVATLPALATSGAISVTNNDGTGTSTQSFTVNPLPAAAGNITGTDVVLPGDTKSYLCAAIANATSYEWTISGDGASITNNGTQADITFAANASAGNRTLTVKGVNSCGDGPISSVYNIYVRPTYACQTTIVNWDFDEPDLGGADWRGYTTVNGWQSSLNNIEIWKSGFMGVTTPDGGQFCELNSTGANEMWQNVATIPGSRMRWAIAYRYRNNNSESVRLKIGAVGATVNIADISNNTSSGWTTHSGYYTVPVGQTTTQFRLESLSPSGSSGNLIDNIQFYSIEQDVEKPTFDAPLDADGDGFIVSTCETSNLVVNNIGLTNLADNCTSVNDLIVEYEITKEDGTVLVNYGDDPPGMATVSDASGYSFPLGINTVTYRVTDLAGNSENSIIKIAINQIPAPVGIYHD
jgi:hypothetical protein